jgi:hypothetical protein
MELSFENKKEELDFSNSSWEASYSASTEAIL